ncbi:MAG: bifunctional diaminohydroxyphosphoribosylaminopyrimidine deaminase/5-amino-6-(5-phosphoribosylamino)uracil reductase RibD [Pseudomonadota bacterium]
MSQDRDWLLKALDLAQQRKGVTFPNPAVGAVVIKNGQVLGQGFHWGAGYPHAEVEALRGIQEEEARGATIYVTLEPCCHFGKTPPCSELLKEKKIKRVVYGYLDPNPKVSGKGAKALAQAGVKVEWVPLQEIEVFYQSYSYWTRTGNTSLTGKLALSKNEVVASFDGRPIKITGQSADDYTHLRRAQADALLTSVTTVIKDDPQLNVRLGSSVLKKNVWILDRRLRFPLDCQLMKSALSITLVHGPTYETNRKEELIHAGLQCIEIREASDQLILSDLARELGNKGFHEAWCEVGPKLFSEFSKAGLFQEIILYHSTQIEVANGKKAFDDEKELAFKNYKKVSEERLGPDLKESWNLK